MTDAPVNVFLEEPTEPVPGWERQKQLWLELNKQIGGNPRFWPLTVKAFYVFGVMLSIFRSVSTLLTSSSLQSTTYLPAFALFGSGIELLGRCIRGNPRTTGTSRDLRAGLRWLASPGFEKFVEIPDDHKLVQTINDGYSIDHLVALRNFAAHGQASLPKDPPELDYLILQELPPLISSGMEQYWAELQRETAPCNALAKASVAPYRNRPIFDTLWAFSRDREGHYLAISEVFIKLDWRYKHPLSP